MLRSCRHYVVLASVVLIVAKGFRVYAEKTFMVFRSWLGKVEGGKIIGGNEIPHCALTGNGFRFTRNACNACNTRIKVKQTLLRR
ncbi:MAG: hypothetical protein BWY26_01261 [Elusimicrobia bacterium ADurb.Bin231]|nr:MAG: hypothetical protein BWY26_01261 [Elusimicrobia bacterium ADurb.Bin231]